MSGCYHVWIDHWSGTTIIVLEIRNNMANFMEVKSKTQFDLITFHPLAERFLTHKLVSWMSLSLPFLFDYVKWPFFTDTLTVLLLYPWLKQEKPESWWAWSTATINQSEKRFLWQAHDIHNGLLWNTAGNRLRANPQMLLLSRKKRHLARLS